MHNYIVEIYEEIGGFMPIVASSKKEAREQAQVVIDAVGVYRANAQIAYRDVEVLNIKKQEKQS